MRLPDAAGSGEPVAAGPVALTAPPDSDPTYETFLCAVARQRLLTWAATAPGGVTLDLSGNRPVVTAALLDGGRTVLQACDPGERGAPAAGLSRVVASRRCLEWIRPAGVPSVVADAAGLALAEDAAGALGRVRSVLQPGGSLLLVVESLVLGLSRLAGAGDWGRLADVPRSGTLVLPNPDGSSTRFFRAGELQDVLGRAGLSVDWLRPRAMLTPATVARTLAQGVGLQTLVATELDMAARADPDASGMHLVVCAHRPG